MKENNFEYEFISDINLDELDLNSKKNGKYVDVLKMFVKNENKTLKMTLKNEKDRESCCSSIRNYIKKNRLDWTLYTERNTYNIYVVRA